MNRRQFLNDLYRRLGALSKDEAERHLTYYAEMLADRMEEGMTEEEAVASMESVDTIAQRILQDAGVPERSVFDDPVESTAPVEEFSQPEAKPKKKRRWLIAALVVVIILIFVLPVASLLGMIAFNTNIGSGGVQIDTDDGSISIGSGGIRIEDEDEVITIGPYGISGIRNETANEAVKSYQAVDREPYTVSTQNIRSIQVEWTAGDVRVQTWDGDEIRFTEMFVDSNSNRGDSDRLSYVIDEGELEIRFNSRKVSANAENKLLTLEIPSSWIPSELEIETASADVFVDGVSAKALHVETASGSITVAGAITHIEADSASGWVDIGCSEVLKNLEVDTASGDVTLSVAKDAPFTLDFESGSGKLDNASAMNLERSGNIHSRGTGGPRMEVDTGSGDLRLMEIFE